MIEVKEYPKIICKDIILFKDIVLNIQTFKQKCDVQAHLNKTDKQVSTM